MYIFCVLWVPLFFLFRRSFVGDGGAGSVWALILGSITAIFQFFYGNLVDSGGFGLSRWLSSFVDIVGLPVLLPLLVYVFFIVFKSFSGKRDFANFILLWLIPVGAIKALSWGAFRSPLLLVLVPLLWTALAMGISLFINAFFSSRRWYVFVFSVLGIIALPVMAVTAYWAIFSHQILLGYSLFFLTMLPLLVSVILDYRRSKR